MSDPHVVALALSAPLLGMFVLIGLSVRRHGATQWVAGVALSWIAGAIDAIEPDWQPLVVGLGSFATVMLAAGAAVYGGRSPSAASKSIGLSIPVSLALLTALLGPRAGYAGLAATDTVLLLVAAHWARPTPAPRRRLAKHALPTSFVLFIVPVVYAEIRRAQGAGPEESTIVVAAGITFLAAVMLVMLTARVVWDETLRRQGVEERLVEREGLLEHSIARARSAERLAAVGTLAAGIAHQINNPVGAILVAAQLELRDSSSRPDREAGLRSTLATIEREALRCAQIVRNVLLFARDDPGRVADHDLNEIAESARSATCDYARTRGARIELERDPRPVTIRGNAIELEQVFVNLIRNGIESRPSGATIDVRVESSPDLASVMIRDDGHGIPDESRERIFEPFYTTRLKEGGSGLGLAVAHGILATHGGEIELVSSDGAGSCFRVLLPRGRDRSGSPPGVQRV